MTIEQLLRSNNQMQTDVVSARFTLPDDSIVFCAVDVHEVDPSFECPRSIVEREAWTRDVHRLLCGR